MVGGRDSIPGSLPPLMGNSPDLPGLAHSPACQTHSVSSECDSRQSIMLQASVHGMADQPLSFLRSTPHTVSRPLCDTSQCTTFRFSISLPRRERKGVDALFHTLDFRGVLYAFPPTLLLTAVVGRMRATSCPVLLIAPAWPQAAMVQLPSGIVSSARSMSPLKVFPLLQGDFTHPSSTMFNLVRDGYRGQGFPVHTAGFLVQSVPPSNKSCLRQKLGHLLYLVYRETDRSCLYLYR